MHKIKYNEKFIKRILVEWLIKQYPNCLIAFEVPFLGKSRRIDILLITNEDQIIVYEIKSKVDQIKTLREQLIDYTRCFSNVNIVVDPKFLIPINNMNLDSYIGKISINIDQEINIINQSSNNINTSIYNLLSILTKKELLTIIGKQKQTVHEIKTLISQSLTDVECKKFITKILKIRYFKQNKLFYKYKQKTITNEDLIYLNHSFQVKYQF